MATVRYTCIGDVRGACGVAHESALAAVACCERDARAVQAGHGAASCSDRRPLVTVDGRPVEREALSRRPTASEREIGQAFEVLDAAILAAHG